MGLVLCVIMFIGAFLLSRRRVGDGLGFVLAAGCLYGWLRANFLDGLTHFCFDAGLLGLYLGVLPRLKLSTAGGLRGPLAWTVVLFGWPLLVVLVGPFLDTQHFLVQLVGLRTAVLFIPLLLIGSILDTGDIRTLGSWAEWCILGASCFAVAEGIVGIEPLFPANAATEIIYASNDIVGGFHRIPASFISAHAYGGTMVALLPLTLSRLEDPGRRKWLALGASALAALGVFACGARSPVILFVLVVIGMFARLRTRPLSVVLVIVAMSAVGYAVAQSSRLQRFETLGDVESVTERLTGSINLSFIEILNTYPMGKGLGSAAGTSIPFFLNDYVRPQIGIESELSRILLEEGLPGLLLWLSFVGVVLMRSGRLVWSEGSCAVGMWIVCASFWATGLIGTGLLASIPATMVLMVYMGRLSEALRAPAWEALGRRMRPEAGRTT